MKKILKKTNRKRLITFLCLAILIIAVSCVYASKGQDNWTTEIYGSTSDGQIPIQDDTEIVLDFEITEDYFQGIAVRLSPQVNVFENETLEFVMIDQETGDIISQYSMELKNEVYQSATFVRLPYENSKGKRVSLHITGTDIHNTPYLYVSDNFTPNTQMYIDEVENDRVLVFSGVYMIHSDINYQYFVKGAVFLLLLLLVCLWPRDVVVREETHAESGRLLWWEKCWQRFQDIVKKYRKAICFIGLSFLYLFLMVFVYRCYIKDVVADSDTKNIVKNDSKLDSIIMDKDTKQWKQWFTATANQLSTLFFDVTVQDCSDEAKLHIQVYDEAENICYHDGYVKVEEIEKKSAKNWKIFLQKEFTSSNGKKVVVSMEPIDFEDTRLEFQTGKSTAKNYIYKDGQRFLSVPVLQVTYKDNAYLKLLFAIFCIMGYAFMSLVYYLFAMKRATVEQAFIPVRLMLGIIYILVIPLYSVPDEYTHIDTAYAISNRILGIEVDSTFGYEYKRTIDIETDATPKYYVTLADYRRLYTSLFEIAEDQYLSRCYVQSAMANANVLCYLPAAVGITIARVLKLGTLPMLLLGRLMNLIVSTLLTYFAICKLPGGKHIAMVYSTTPIVLQEAASFSYDGMINSFAILFVAFCLYFAYDRKQKSTMDIMVLLVSMFFMASIKGGVYTPLCFLILLIPIEQKWNIKKYAGYIVAVMFCIIASFLQNNIASLLKRIFLSTGDNINSFTGTEMYTIGYLVKHPFKLVSLYVNTFFTMTSQDIYQFFGGGISAVQMPWMYIIAFLVIFLIVVFSKDFFVTKCNRFLLIFSGVIVLSSVALVDLSMLVAFTSTAYDYIAGVQGRYFIPCMLPLFLLINYCLNRKNDIDLEKTKLIYYVIHVVFLFNIVMLAV